MLGRLTLLLLVILAQCEPPKFPFHSIPLYGNFSLGYYYANILLGTPGQ